MSGQRAATLQSITKRANDWELLKICGSVPEKVVASSNPPDSWKQITVTRLKIAETDREKKGKTRVVDSCWLSFRQGGLTGVLVVSAEGSLWNLLCFPTGLELIWINKLDFSNLFQSKPLKINDPAWQWHCGGVSARVCSSYWMVEKGINRNFQSLNPRWKPSDAQFLQIQHSPACVALSKQSSARKPLFAISVIRERYSTSVYCSAPSNFDLRPCCSCRVVVWTIQGNSRDQSNFKFAVDSFNLSLNPIHVCMKRAKDLGAVNFKDLPYWAYYKKCIHALVALVSKAFIRSLQKASLN